MARYKIGMVGAIWQRRLPMEEACQHAVSFMALNVPTHYETWCGRERETADGTLNCSPFADQKQVGQECAHIHGTAHTLWRIPTPTW